MLAILAVAASVAVGQTATPLPADDSPIKIDTVLLNIPVIVSDKSGRYIAGLKKEDFSITLDGEKQEVEYFGDAEVPLTVAIVLDISFSTRPHISEFSKAAKAFVEQLRPDDQGFVVTFDEFTDIVCPLTSDKGKIKKKLDPDYLTELMRESFRNSDPKRVSSNMYDGLYRVVTREMAGIKGRKAVIVLTDGFVNGTISQIAFHNAMVQGDALIYPMMFLTRGHIPAGKTSISWNDLITNKPGMQMNQIASETGGRLLVAGKDLSFKEAFQNVADELRKQYLLGFYPSRLGGARGGSIVLGVARPDVLVRTKKSINARLPDQ